MRRLLLLAVAALAIGVLAVVAYQQLTPPETSEPAAESETPTVLEPEPVRPKESEASPLSPLSGVVVDSGGEPVPGTIVSARGIAPGTWPGADSEPIAANGPTDAEGRFLFPEILPGTWMLTAHKGERIGYLPAVRVDDAAERSVVILLADPIAIEGRILRDDSTPVVGAVVTTDLGGVVRPFYDALGVSPPPLEERFEAKTGPGGAFRIAPLMTGQYDLKVTAPGLETVVARVVYAPIDGIDIVMRQGIELRGTVRWQRREEPTNLRVWADISRPMTSVMETSGDRVSEWALKWFGNGRYRIRAVADGYCESWVDVEVESGSRPEPFEISLQPAVPVSGEISLPYGAPGEREILFYRVIRRLTRPHSHYPKAVTTYGEPHRVFYDKDGRFATHLAPGLWVVHSDSKGFHLVAAPSEFRVARIPVVLKPLVLQRFGVVRGRVAYADGAPAVRAGVELSGRRHKRTRTRTNLNGEYELWGLWPWESYNVSLSMRSSSIRDERVRLPKGEWEVRQDFDLDRSWDGRARGRITDPSGEPVPGALIFLNGIPCESGPDGRFEVRRVDADHVRVSYFALGFTVVEKEFRKKAEDGLLDLGDLVLERKGTSFSGMVVDSEGLPIGGARVSALFGDDYPVAEVATGPDGRYEIVGPAHLNEAWIKADTPGRATSLKQLKSTSPGGSETFKLRDLSFIRGTLNSPGHRPRYVDLAVRESRQRKHDYEWMELDASLDDRGRSFAAGLEWEGKIWVRILAEGCAVKDLPVASLRTGETLDLGRIDLEPGYHVEGRALGGSSLRHVCLVELGLVARTDSEGKFRIDHVPEGTWTLREYRPWYKSIGPKMEVRVEPGRLYPVEFHLGD